MQLNSWNKWVQETDFWHSSKNDEQEDKEDHPFKNLGPFRPFFGAN